MQEEVSSAIKTLVAFTKTDECPQNIKDVFNPKYGVTIYSEDEFELVYGLITMYCVARVLDETSTKLLRPQLLHLLSIYFLQGINDKESRKLALDVLNIEKTSLNSLNADLRNLGFTIKNPMRTGMDTLNSGLLELRNYYLAHKDEPMFTVKLVSRSGTKKRDSND